MALSTPRGSTLFPSGQLRQQFGPYWGVYASAATLPNAVGGGNTVVAADFRIETGDHAFVTGVGLFVVTAAGTAGGNDTVWASQAGNVVGPAASTDNAFVRWDGATGKLVQNSVGLLTDTGEGQFGDGAVGTPSLSFTADTNTGLWRPGSGLIGFTGDGLEVMRTSAPAGANPQLLLAAGTAPLPVVSFAGDPNTGVYNVGPDQLGSATGGVLRLTISTTAVTSTLPFLAPDGAVGAPSYSFSSDTNTGHYWVSSGVVSVVGDGLEVCRFSAPAAANPQVLLADGVAAKPALAWVTDGGMGLYRDSANSMSFTTGGAVRMSFMTGGITFASTSATLTATGTAQSFVITGGITSGAAPTFVASNIALYTGGAGIAQVGTYLKYGVNQSATADFTALRINLTGTAAGIGATTPTFGSGGGLAIKIEQGGTAPTVYGTWTMFGGIGVAAVSPAALAAGNTDNYAGIGAYGVARITSDGAGSVLRGIVAPTDSRMLTICHIAGLTLTINNQDAGSTAANRIITGTGAALVLVVDDAVQLWYDLTTARWRVVSTQS